MDTAVDLIRHSKDLRAMWQGRVLEAAQGRMLIAVSSILAHSYDEAMAILFRVVAPKCWDAFRQTLRTPFLCSCGKIAKDGTIVADAILFDGAVKASKVIFTGIHDFQTELRRLADKARLSDSEREEFFVVAQKWVVADTRLDPTMDPRDPDARRLVH